MFNKATVVLHRQFVQFSEDICFNHATYGVMDYRWQHLTVPRE
jgi:hypothetical protein